MIKVEQYANVGSNNLPAFALFKNKLSSYTVLNIHKVPQFQPQSQVFSIGILIFYNYVIYS
jgi:hypothetical protein